MNFKTLLKRALAVLVASAVSISAGWFVLAKPVFTYWDNFGWYTLFLPVIILALIYGGLKLWNWAMKQFDYDGDGIVEFDDFQSMMVEIADDFDLEELQDLLEKLNLKLEEKKKVE